MAINLAAKYSDKIAQAFTLGSLTDAGGNKDYEFSGVTTVTVYSLTTQALGDYTKTGTARYGTPAELQDTKQDLTMTKDRSFTITIDAGNNDDQINVKQSGKVLKMQINEQILPEIDTYRLAVMSAAAITATGTAITAVTASNAYLMLLNAGAYMDNAKVPATGRIAFVTPAYYNFIKQDSSFVKACDMGMEKLAKGVLGDVDGVQIIKIPSSYFPANHAFILCHPATTVFAQKLTDYKVTVNPPGINGTLIEGRVRYDAFVLTTKNKGVYAHKIA